MQVSEHLSLEELTHSEKATELGIDNTIPADLIPKAYKLGEFFERIRAIIGGPLHINSGYRCPDLNKAVNGQPTSQHMKCEALDLRSDEHTPQGLYSMLANSDLVFDQLILEFCGSSVWVHVSYALDKAPYEQRMEKIPHLIKKVG